MWRSLIQEAYTHRPLDWDQVWIDEADSITRTPRRTYGTSPADRITTYGLSLADISPTIRSYLMEEPHESPSMVDPSPSAGECDIAADHPETTPPEDEGLTLAQSALVALSQYPTINTGRVYGLPRGHRVDGAHLYHQHEQNIERVANIMIPMDMWISNGGDEHLVISKPEAWDYVYIDYRYQDWFYYCGNNRTIIKFAASLINITWKELAETTYAKYGCEARGGSWPVPYHANRENMRQACQALMRRCLEIVHDHLPPLQPITGIAQSVYTL